MSDPKRREEPWLRSPGLRSAEERTRSDIGSGLPVFWLDLLTRRRPPSERYRFRSLIVLALIAAAVMIAAVVKDNRTSDLYQLQGQAAPMMAIPLAGEQPALSSTTSTAPSATTTSTSTPGTSAEANRSSESSGVGSGVGSGSVLAPDGPDG